MVGGLHVSDETNDDRTPRTPLGDFLDQPAHHYEEDDTEAHVTLAASVVDHRSLLQRLNAFLFDKKPSEYSSLAPRQADGRRTKIFFFNGNGRGR
jgi:hypothetical protein